MGANIPFSDQKAHWFYSDLREIENPSLPSEVTNLFFARGRFATELSTLSIRISPLPKANQDPESSPSKERKNIGILIPSQ
jgi:hypothetical protein